MKILFVCRGNVGRSQMATAIFNKLSRKHHAFSAGTHVGEKEGQQIHDYVIEAMGEFGLDLLKNKRKQLNMEMVREADKVIILCEKREKRDFPEYLKNLRKVIYWQVEDGKGRDYEFHIKMRDQIKNLVEKLVKEIG